MSREWKQKFDASEEVVGFAPIFRTSEEMRSFVMRPGKKLPDGKPCYYTEQGHKKECDVNEIIKKYDRTGLISHISRIEAKFGDLTGADFKTMQDKVANAMSMFEELPAHIKNRFEQSPAKLLEFMEHKENREEAIKLGLIDSRWSEEEDGLGEHVIRESSADDFPVDKEPAAA